MLILIVCKGVKMKKVLVLLLGLFLITGCGNEKEVEKKELDISKVGSQLQSVESFKDLNNLNDEDLIKGYGIDLDLMEEYAIYISSAVSDPSMYIVAKAKSSKESVLKFQIKDMFSKYLSSYMGYYPEAVPMIENRLEKEYDGYLIYIVSENNEEIYNKIIECNK